MPERLTDDQLERELVELGKRLDLPAPPQVVAPVRQRIASQVEAGGPRPVSSGRPGPGQARAWWRNPRLLQAAAAVLLVFAALLALSPQVRAAVRDVLRFAGIEIHEESAPVRPTPTGHPALPGERIVTLAEAQAQADFAIRVPAELGAPDEVRVADGEPPRVVSLIYRAGPGRPAADSSGVSIRIDEFAGSLSPVYEKYGAQVEKALIDGSPGLWVPRPHTLLYIDRSGSFREEAARMSAQTLIWQVGTTTLRMEGDFTKDEAIGIARSTLPSGPRGGVRRSDDSDQAPDLLDDVGFQIHVGMRKAGMKREVFDELGLGCSGEFFRAVGTQVGTPERIGHLALSSLGHNVRPGLRDSPVSQETRTRALSGR